MFKKILFTLGFFSNLFSADYASIAAAYEQNPNPENTIALSKATIKIVLDVLEEREQYEGVFSDDLEKTIQDFNVFVQNDGFDSKGILMATIPSNPLSDMTTNPKSVVILSALSHVVNFPYDPTAVPQYDRVGDGAVVYGTFHLENLAKAMQVACSVQQSSPHMMDETIEGGKFKTFADVLTTYNAFKAYLTYLHYDFELPA